MVQTVVTGIFIFCYIYVLISIAVFGISRYVCHVFHLSMPGIVLCYRQILYVFTVYNVWYMQSHFM